MKRGALRDFKLWIGVSLSVLFSFLALRGVDLRGLLEVAKRANLLPLSMAFFIAYAILWVRARRWGILLRPLGPMSEWLLFRMTLLGFLGNYLLPARMGEVVRAVFLGSRTGNRASSIFGTIVVERLLDLGSIILVFFIVTFSAPFLDEEKALKEALQATAFALLLAGAGMTAFLWLLKVRREETLGIFSKTLGKILPKLSYRLVNLLSSFSQGLQIPRGGRDLGEIAIWTLGVWTLSATVVFLVSESLELGLGWGACWFVLVVLGLGVSVPSAPGFIGTFHYAAMASVMAYGVGKTEALSFAIVLHGICILPVMVVGLPLLWLEGTGLRTMSRAMVKKDVKDG